MRPAPAGRDESLREEGKRRADVLRAEFEEKENALGWFDACYAQAGDQAALIPWAHQVARPEFVEWLDALPAERRRGRALDVGCGLGDNAVLLAEAGFDVTAFDISSHAVEWARRRFPERGIDWRVADLTRPPAEFAQAFDLVNETYTLQALRPPFREAAIAALPRMVSPGGTLLVIGRGRHADEPEDPPPWPLVENELEPIERAGFSRVRFDDFFTDRKGRPVRHFRAEYARRPAGQ